MKFLKKEGAPNIPERMLRLHEDGKLIFFCGAGISIPAGLPGFEKLVDSVYDQIGINRNPHQVAAFKSKRYDLAISLLETDIKEGRARVRKQISELMHKPINTEKSLSMHKSILSLSINRNNKLRLVTTNFDRLFEHVLLEEMPNKKSYIAPLVPLINSHWDGIVYLHGLVSEEPEFGENGPIIVSSGDFGQAYLVDRWASKFLSNLFKNYSICFVGYSLEDPIVRYITDALTASKLIGENPPEMFSFSPYKAKEWEKVDNNWKSKGITPILYNQKYSHSLLRDSLEEWSKEYKDKFLGKVRVIEKWENTKPLKRLKP